MSPSNFSSVNGDAYLIDVRSNGEMLSDYVGHNIIGVRRDFNYNF